MVSMGWIWSFCREGFNKETSIECQISWPLINILGGSRVVDLERNDSDTNRGSEAFPKREEPGICAEKYPCFRFIM